MADVERHMDVLERVLKNEEQLTFPPVVGLVRFFLVSMLEHHAEFH